MQRDLLMKHFSLITILGSLISCSNETRPTPGSISRRSVDTAEIGMDAPNTQTTPNENAEGNTSGDAMEKKEGSTPPPSTATSAPNMMPTAATGKVAVDFTPVAPTPAGRFAPANIMAVFVTDANNVLIKTLFATPGGVRAQYLRRWQKLAGMQADGFTGATLAAVAKPATAPFTWDMKNRAGTVVPNGNYKIWFEIATDNIPALPADVTNTALSGTLAIDTARGYKSLIVPIVIGSTGSTKTDTTNQAFTNVSIVHTP